MASINDVDVDELRTFKQRVVEDPTAADRHPTVTAHWVGGGRSRYEFREIEGHLGGDGELNPMQALLASFAACDVDLLSMHAALIGLELERLSVEATGHFNVQSYLGLENKPGSGYEGISYRIRIKAPGVTPEQIAYLRERCERSSPVGDSLARAIPMELELEVDES